MPFTIFGLQAEDTGTVTFTDGTHRVTVNVTGGQTSYTANLTSLTDGPVTSSLQVNRDAAGNTFTPVAGNTVTLDRDSGEQAALKLTVTLTAISAATAPSVPFTIAGLDPEDTGTVTFTDSANHTVVVNVNGNSATYTANLSSLADGTITSSLSVNADAAGNAFTPVAGTKVTLTQFDHWVSTVNGNWATASSWKLGLPTATVDADVDAGGTYSIATTTNDIAYGLLLNNASATVTDNGGVLTLAGPGGSGNPNGALNINARTFVLNGGTFNAGSIFIASGSQFTIDQSYTGKNALAETITDNGSLTISGSVTVTIANAISGSGAINLLNSSTGIFNGAIAGSEVFNIENSASAVINTAISGNDAFNLTNSANLEFAAADLDPVTFQSGASGVLKLDHSVTAPMTGTISGLTSKDGVDLADLTWTPGKMAANYVANASGSGGTLTVTNGTNRVTLYLSGTYSSASWSLSKDGTGTLVVDPPVTGSLSTGIDLSNINYGANTTLAYAPNSTNTGGTLTVSDGLHAQSLALLGQYTASSFVMAAATGGGTLITDPPHTQQPLLTHPHA